MAMKVRTLQPGKLNPADLEKITHQQDSLEGHVQALQLAFLQPFVFGIMMKTTMMQQH